MKLTNNNPEGQGAITLFPIAAPELSKERYDICKECDRFFSLTTTCKECGCFMIAKTKMASAKCPLGKW